ncbi:hypothetical protein FH972_020894 [Carpinus fangiana]|uniref:Uncharacterized protein n=1 Tax=Carpinus fangiana TaxID=176857 RepID=A0A5N6RXT4_9ROSI|nr:hypothetical protein FH972_020894 [Carpinus fangiana]
MKFRHLSLSSGDFCQKDALRESLAMGSELWDSSSWRWWWRWWVLRKQQREDLRICLREGEELSWWSSSMRS